MRISEDGCCLFGQQHLPQRVPQRPSPRACGHGIILGVARRVEDIGARPAPLRRPVAPAQSARARSGAPSEWRRALAPDDVMELQRQAGNRAVASLLAQPSPSQPSVQRILGGGGYLYAPKTWMDTQFDDRDDTVRDVMTQGAKRELKNQLFANVEAATGVGATEATTQDFISTTTATASWSTTSHPPIRRCSPNGVTR